MECLSQFDSNVKSRKEKTALISQTIPDVDLRDAWLKKEPAQSFRKFAKSIGLTARASGKQRLIRLGLITEDTTAVLPPRADPCSVILDENTSLSWIAGLLEGEGCFTYSGRAICISLEMTDEDVIQRFCDFTKATYRKVPSRQLGWKDSFCVRLSGDRAARLLTRILPYMGERRTEKILERLSVHASVTIRKEEREAQRAIRLPLEDFKNRWVNRQAGDSLYKISREFGVHPQSLKSQLLKLGIYQVPPQSATAGHPSN